MPGCWSWSRLTATGPGLRRNCWGSKAEAWACLVTDKERIERWKRIGLRINRVDGPLFHLSHPRDQNGKHRSDIQRQNSMMILENTIMSDRKELMMMFNNVNL